MTFFIDLDGTIINSIERHYLLLNELLKKNKVNKNIDKEKYYTLKRDGINNYNYLINNLLLEQEKALLIKNEWIKEIEELKWITFDKLYDDSIFFLDSIKNNKIYYLTARKNKKNVRLQISNFKLKEYAQNTFIVDSKNPVEGKIKIVEKYQKEHPKEKLIIIGDTEVEFLTAKKLKIECYILNRGFRSKQFLLKNGINKTYNNLYEITKEVKHEEC